MNTDLERAVKAAIKANKEKYIKDGQKNTEIFSAIENAFKAMLDSKERMEPLKERKILMDNGGTLTKPESEKETCKQPGVPSNQAIFDLIRNELWFRENKATHDDIWKTSEKIIELVSKPSSPDYKRMWEDLKYTFKDDPCVIEEMNEIEQEERKEKP